jgi:GDP-L-fucose synthase
MNLRDKKILVTGGAGFLGSFVVKELLKKGVSLKNITIPRSKTCDLRLMKNCQKAVRDKDIIIHLAGIVGGIGFNRAVPGQMFYDNLMMGAQLIEAARLAGIKKFVAIGTICAYPKIVPVPFAETSLWHGYPEETNAPYGLAKKMLLVQSQAYRQQYSFNSIYLLPTNLYGPGDNFDPKNSHVIPALIKKVADAKAKGKKQIEVWGTGKASREFLYVEDCAKGIIMATEKYDKPQPVNLGANREITIKELIKTICRLMNFKEKIIWDKTKPDGQPRRMVDASLAKKEFGFKAETDFENGLKKTIDWYLNFKNGFNQ